MRKKLIVVIVLAVCVIVFYLNNKKTKDYENIYLEESTQEKVDNSVQTESTIKVHIAGEVNNPGIYEIEENSRIDDVIKIAGGVTENADINKINLAYEVSDAEKIYIPSIFDEEIEYNVSSNVNSNGKVNINKANAEELQKLNGVGEALARKIITYREEVGKFTSVEDLKNVSGIGDKKFETIKEQVVIK